MDAATRDLFLAQDGDDQAFSRIVRACESDVRRFCVWFSGPTDDIDDVTQETFFRAYRGLQSYRGDSTAQSWLLSIARRVCLDHAERKKKDVPLVARLKTGRVVHEDAGVSVELRQLISALPIQFREAFVLVRIFGFGYDEAANVLNCPRGTVQSRVARAREFLSQQVATTENRQFS